jgi:hypothetical protein
MACASASADDQTSAPVERRFKLSIGEYFYSDPGGRYTGEDINLRYRRDDTSLWIGQYHDRSFGNQTRAGTDTSWNPFKGVDLSIQPSLQVATRGFIGGSLNLQYGTPWFVVVGIGRTNLRPYQNLNFDPNDAVTAGIGHRSENGSTVSVTTIKDDRLHTGQRHTHASVQLALPRGHRLTLDLLRKSGMGDSGVVHAWGESVTYDFPSWFIRAVHDPKQSFGTADATRITVGLRF